jgi:monoamine oxidase
MRVQTSRGTVESRSVIVTVPTSVLARDELAFQPALPLAWREAFHHLPLGIANKVFFQLPAEHPLLAEPRHFIGSAARSRTGSYASLPADQPLLAAYFGGDLARELETQGALEAFAREELAEGFGAEFRNALGAAVCTAWATDPFARGSYSAARPGYAHCREQLATPPSPQVQFAGEACSAAYYGTLHGAWLSGTAAADRLLGGTPQR